MTRPSNTTSSLNARFAGTVGVLVILYTVFTVISGGCNIPNTGPTPTPGTGTLSGTMSLNSNIKLSGDQTVTIVYSVSESASNVSAFYVPVESTDINAPATGAEVVFRTNLDKGDNKTVSLQTTGLVKGLYRIGLEIVGNGETVKVYSQGTFELTDLPEPVFEKPNQNLVLVPGEYVEVLAQLGDPENAVQWRLFYIETPVSTNGTPIDELGTEIDTGTANVANLNWNTFGIPYGTYRLGISSTDTGQSIAQAVAAGDSEEIVTVYSDYILTFQEESADPKPPTVEVTEPAQDEYVTDDSTYLIEFDATVYEGPASQQGLTVFYDFDGKADTKDEHVISANLPISATSAVFAGSVLEKGDEVYIGVTVDDGKNDPVTSYADGTIALADPAQASIKVIRPNNSLPIKPGTSVNVTWQLVNLPSTAAAKVDVYYYRIDSDGNPTGSAVEILASSALTTTTTKFTLEDTGRYQVTVRVKYDDGETADLVAVAPNLVVVSTQPKIFWLGHLLTSESALDGVIFEGVQPEDNAGSSFAGAEDFDQDGLSEFFVVSRYAKQDFVNPDGIGAGQAYMLRGSEQRLTGSINLNSVADSVPGFVFKGIIPDSSSSSDTDGIASLFISRDADGDRVGELVFGFPHVFSQRLSNHPLSGPFLDDPFSTVTDPQFSRGGVVIVSSQNDELVTDDYDLWDRQCSLDWVGQHFQANTVFGSQAVFPEFPDDGNYVSFCSSHWMSDELRYIDPGEANCPPDGGFPMWLGCDWDEGDGEKETLIQPNFGFNPKLASSFPMYMLNDYRQFPCETNSSIFGSLEGEGKCPAFDASSVGDPSECFSHVISPSDSACVSYKFTEEELEGGLSCNDNNEILELDVLNMGIASTWNYGYDSPREYLSGFYRQEITIESDSTDWSDIEKSYGSNHSLIGCRIIGREVNEGFGTYIGQSSNNLLVTSPYHPLTLTIDGEGRGNGGVGYTINTYTSFDNQAYYWQLPDKFDPYSVYGSPPQPHQYLAGANNNLLRDPNDPFGGNSSHRGSRSRITGRCNRLPRYIGCSYRRRQWRAY